MIALALLFVLVVSVSCDAGVINVKSHGAVGDGRHDDTKSIAAALTLAESLGGGTVLLPAPGVYLSGSQVMRSHTVFRVAHGATLRGSIEHDAYPFQWYPGSYKGVGGCDRETGICTAAPTGASNSTRQGLINGGTCKQVTADGKDCAAWKTLTNVTIDGGGTIDGQGQGWWWANDGGSPDAHLRPDMVQPYLVNGLTIRDVTLANSPSWTLHPLLCNNVHILNITIKSGQFDNDREYSGHNVDGCDPDSCSNVVFENSLVHAGDDCVAIYSMKGPTSNVTVRNVTCHTPLSITHGAGGTSDVLFENCTVRGDWGNAGNFKPQWWKTAMRLKSDRKTNGTLERITYKNIHAVGVDLLLDIQMWYPCQNQSGMHNYDLCRSYYDVQPGIRPHIRDVRVIDSVAPDAWRSLWLNCLPESPCENITFENVVTGSATLPAVCENVRGSVSGSSSFPECF